jgi:hypothetical protein
MHFETELYTKETKRELRQVSSLQVDEIHNAKTKRRTSMIIKSQQEFLEQKTSSVQDKELLNQVQALKKDLTFLLDQDFNEYGDELEQKLKQDEDDLMAKFLGNQSICFFDSGG